MAVIKTAASALKCGAAAVRYASAAGNTMCFSAVYAPNFPASG